MSPLAVSIIVIAVLAVAFFVIAAQVRSHVYAQLQRDIETGDLDAFFARVDGHAARALLAPYGRELLRFRAIALRGNRSEMAEQYNRLMKLKLNGFELSSILTEGFNAFAAKGDAKHCRRIVEEMEKGGFTDAALKAYRRHLEIVLEHKPAGRAELERRYAGLTGKRRAYAAYLLSKLAESTNDAEGAARYRREAASLYGCTTSDLDRRAHVVTTV